jgi:hypothetical protein
VRRGGHRSIDRGLDRRAHRRFDAIERDTDPPAHIRVRLLHAHRARADRAGAIEQAQLDLVIELDRLRFDVQQRAGARQVLERSVQRPCVSVQHRDATDGDTHRTTTFSPARQMISHRGPPSVVPRASIGEQARKRSRIFASERFARRRRGGCA